MLAPAVLGRVKVGSRSTSTCVRVGLVSGLVRVATGRANENRMKSKITWLHNPGLLDGTRAPPLWIKGALTRREEGRTQ